MLLRPLSRPLPSLLLGFAVTFLAAAPRGAGAHPLDEETCNRLRTERQSLATLGADKNFERGADWAKVNLKPADLNLVKRYLDVFEQIKFRCEKIAAVAEPEEKDEDDDEGEAGGLGAPPVPERNGTRPAPAKAALQPPPALAMPEADEPNSTEIVKSPGKRPTNASAVQLGARKDLPTR
ncbi:MULTISPECIES: hypothetical protein [Rhodomicrobium]|uniref:hypothetical protein n=1 Tax=Rhodomicrobium TaxID=1068 RepID=UPI000B4BFA75|nr:MULTISPECIES: hypothetical protein [Rhodomicrobium]